MDSVFPDLMYGDACTPTEVYLALADFALALCALLGTLLIPFLIMCQILRVKRRAVRVAALRVAAERDGQA
jgi:hypothetical protein